MHAYARFFNIKMAIFAFDTALIIETLFSGDFVSLSTYFVTYYVEHP